MWAQACTPTFSFGLFCGSVVSSLNQGKLPQLRLKAPPPLRSLYFVAPIQFQNPRPHCPRQEILRRQGRWRHGRDEPCFNSRRSRVGWLQMSGGFSNISERVAVFETLWKRNRLQGARLSATRFKMSDLPPLVKGCGGYGVAPSRGRIGNDSVSGTGLRRESARRPRALQP